MTRGREAKHPTCSQQLYIISSFLEGIWFMKTNPGLHLMYTDLSSKWPSLWWDGWVGIPLVFLWSSDKQYITYGGVRALSSSLDIFLKSESSVKKRLLKVGSKRSLAVTKTLLRSISGSCGGRLAALCTASNATFEVRKRRKNS